MSTLSNDGTGVVSSEHGNDTGLLGEDADEGDTPTRRVLRQEDELVFPMSKGAFSQYWEDEETPRELRVFYRDKEISMVRLRAFGKYAVRIVNAQQFVNTVVGTVGAYSADRVESYFRDVIVARLTDLLGENLQTIFDLPKVYDELAMGLKARVTDDFGKYGIDLVDLFLGAITPPEEVQKMIDERSGMGVVGDMNAYLKFKTARAIGDAAQQPGGAAGAGIGLGAGVGVGMMLPQMMRDAMQSGGPTPAAPAAPSGGPAPAPAAAPATASADGAAAATPAFCSQCGTKLPPGSRFCPGCGAKVA